MGKAVKAPSDLVSDSKLQTSIGPGYIEHTYYARNVSRSGPVTSSPVTERWVRDGTDAFLGEGTYGTVYRERCGDKLRAVKELRKSVVPGEALEITRELEAVAKFSHPKYSRCFVMSHGWYEVDASVFISMEYFPHGDLFRHIKEPLPEVEAKSIVSQVLEGLEHMHNNRFIHRDLKPRNIMVVETAPYWLVKIADFGISKRRQEGVTTYQTMNRGTQGYAAPEVFGLYPMAGGETSSEGDKSHNEYALDMWSTGAMAYSMLTKELPFPTPADLMFYSIGRKPFPAERLIEFNVSSTGIDFIQKLMAPEPRARLSTKEARTHSWVLPELYGLHLQRDESSEIDLAYEPSDGSEADSWEGFPDSEDMIDGLPKDRTTVNSIENPGDHMNPSALNSDHLSIWNRSVSEEERLSVSRGPGAHDGSDPDDPSSRFKQDSKQYWRTRRLPSRMSQRSRPLAQGFPSYYEKTEVPGYEDIPARSATRVGHHSTSRGHNRRPSEATPPTPRSQDFRNGYDSSEDDGRPQTGDRRHRFFYKEESLLL